MDVSNKCFHFTTALAIVILASVPLLRPHMPPHHLFNPHLGTHEISLDYHINVGFIEFESQAYTPDKLTSRSEGGVSSSPGHTYGYGNLLCG